MKLLREAWPGEAGPDPWLPVPESGWEPRSVASQLSHGDSTVPPTPCAAAVRNPTTCDDRGSHSITVAGVLVPWPGHLTSLGFAEVSEPQGWWGELGSSLQLPRGR